MNKTIIKKEVTEYGHIEIQFTRGDSNYSEIMRFDDEVELKAFTYLLRIMVATDASSLDVG